MKQLVEVYYGILRIIWMTQDKVRKEGTKEQKTDEKKIMRE